MTLVLAADMGVKSLVGGQGTAEAASCRYNLIFWGGEWVWAEANFELLM